MSYILTFMSLIELSSSVYVCFSITFEAGTHHACIEAWADIRARSREHVRLLQFANGPLHIAEPDLSYEPARIDACRTTAKTRRITAQ